MASIDNYTTASQIDGIKRALWRKLLRWRFRLLQRRRYNRLVLEQVNGHHIVVLPQVFNPRLFRTGEYLAGSLDEKLVPPGSTVLDMGTGSGVGALAAARWAERVVAVDINPAAVRCARINALLNHLEERIEVREGNLFDPLHDERFDIVLFNPPFFRGVPRDDLERAFWSDDMAVRFATGLPRHLTPGGYALVLLSSDGDEQGFLQAFRAGDLIANVVCSRAFGTERLTIYRVENALRQLS